MNAIRNKHPGTALQRGAGAVMESREGTQNPTTGTYTNLLDQQRRHLRNRYRLTEAQASALCALIWGIGA